MKSGASDPFAEGEGNDGDAGGHDGTRSEGDPDPDRGPGADTPASGTDTASGTEDGSDADVASASGERLSREQLPYVLRRDRVKDERPEIHQLFVRRETHDRAVDAERELADRLDDDLSRTDAREAIYLAGMAHLDDAETVLRDWGYDL